jgi:hypothetical protein
MIAALYVEAGGVYADLPDVELWDEARDARQYAGPWTVVAHPPCQRWGRFFHGSPRKPHQFKLGDDGGCFAAALAAVRRWGGVLEHPADSHAWLAHGLPWPPGNGWQCDITGGCELPDLIWGSSGQRLDPVMVERHGYEKARRVGIVAMVGGKRKTEIRNATPPEFRDLLISIASTKDAK